MSFRLPSGKGRFRRRGAGRLEYLGEDAVRLEPDGYIEWTFTVPEEARYTLGIRYAAVQDDGRDLTIGLQLDGQTPFTQAEATPLSRVWRDGPARQDSRGNDLIPEQEEIIAWQDTRLIDNSSYMTEPYALYLTAGPHTLRLYAGEEPLVLAQVVLGGEQEVPTYAQALAAYEQQGLAPAGEICLTQQGEDTTLKSHRTLYPVYDRSNASTVPNDPALIKRNVIGQSNWSQSGMWISYTIPDVPEDGLYCLTIKYRQNTQLGMSVFRNIYINNELPYEELCSVRFPFGFGWENLTIADEDGTPYYVYLKKGDNTIAFEATVGSWSDILQEADVLASEMNDLYRRIIMVTSTNPDTYRDYFLERGDRWAAGYPAGAVRPAGGAGRPLRRGQWGKVQPVRAAAPRQQTDGEIRRTAGGNSRTAFTVSGKYRFAVRVAADQPVAAAGNRLFHAPRDAGRAAEAPRQLLGKSEIWFPAISGGVRGRLRHHGRLR